MKLLGAFSSLVMASSLWAEEASFSIPVYDLTGVITEGGQAETNLFGFDPNPQRPITHFDIVTSLERAVESEEVPAVVVELDQAGFSFAQLEEIRRKMLAVQKAGKEVWLYTDNLSFQTALLGSAATEVVLNPEGGVMMSGLHSENLYFKGLLDKLGVLVDVVHIGDFKSAGENFYRKGPSEAAQKQSGLLLDSLYNTLVTEIAQGREITRDSLHAFIDRGVVTAEEAQKAGLVDRLQSRTDFVTTLEEKYGEEAIFDRSYVRNGEEDPEIKGFFDLMKLLFNSKKSSVLDEPYLGVVVLDSAISFASIEPVRSEVLKLVHDEMCKALVLRVNSPGGSALASEVLWEALDEFSQTERPFIVSMGSVAASGGYYVASGADMIFAEPMTITGSIGVVGMKVALGEMMDSIGVTTHEMKRGAHADLYNSTRRFSPVEREMVRESMLEVYDVFKQRIIDGRGERLVGELEPLAGGRVYSGRDALRVGLVDEVGGLGEAMTHARELAELDSLNTILLPRPKSPFDTLFPQSLDEDEGEEFISLGKAGEPLSLLEGWMSQDVAFKFLPIEKRQQVDLHLSQLQSLQQDRIQLIAPPLPNF